MNNILNKFLLIFLVVQFLTIAQTTGFVDNFNDGDIDGWVSEHDRTFKVSNDDSSLQVIYTRSASSDQWDNFNYTPPLTIDMTGNKFISLKVKSNIGTQLTLKPVYEDGNDDWLQANLIGDSLWHSVTFELSPRSNYVMNKMYLYLDGGTTTSKNGIVYIDDIAFGDSASIELDYTALENAIIDANNLLANTQEGSGEGQFLIGSKNDLEAAINIAQDILNDKPEDREIINGAIWNLYDACTVYETNSNVSKYSTVDPLATKQTKYLLENLKELSGNGLMFGMHDATGYGVGWSGDDDRSDVKDVCSDYPAVYSEDVFHIDRNHNLDRVRYRMESAYNRGGIITFVWHQYDPDGRSFYSWEIDNERIVEQIIPGGTRHNDYKEKLYKVANFFKSLRGEKGETIPVIFRPYHEHTGDWFWWGPAHCTTEEYNTIWKFTYEYLHDSLNVHNLIWAISPSFQHFNSSSEYQNIYPGDNYIDVIGADKYFGTNPAEFTPFISKLSVMNDVAKQKNKISALTEVGNENLVNPNWFTQVLDAIKTDDSTSAISYAAVWRNQDEGHHFAPYPGHAVVPDFIKFYDDPFTMFEQDLPNMYVEPVEDTIAPVIVNIPDTTIIATSTSFDITVETNERAFVKYSIIDESYENMTNTFDIGEGTFQHTTALEAEQGEIVKLYLRTADRSGNISQYSTVITIQVDTMKAPIAWFDPKYPNHDWESGKATLGVDPNAITQLNEAQTYYFTAEFELNELPENMGLLTKSYGGAVVYLNGTEVGRINIDENIEIYYNTNPTANSQFNQIIVFDSTALTKFKTGANLLAVEIHSTAGSSPQSFDAQLFDANGIIISLGSNWDYFDLGYEPKSFLLEDITSVNENDLIPTVTRLNNNYPNPFNPSTKISFDIAKKAKVELVIFNILGQRVKTLVKDNLNPGSYEYQFNAKKLSSGMYIAVLKSSDFMFSQKMILMK